ncbi:hypothetical protein BDV26DRAFT_285655 [Aspergillus bertholletiae]|uniref:Transaldolase n=1 Tax=Aspergillus bertholletiae TaxID=1226010 RepID=A0A5N7AU11_9EURO|nr:hypothetical protein BDV26DRAFT_285655 [Aspergillus bertholletiae]
MGSAQQPSTWLDKRQGQLNIDIDCMDPAEAKRWFPFTPHDQTSNQRLVYEQMISTQNRELFLQAAREYKDKGREAILTRVSALLCAENIDNIKERVLLQTSAFGAYDTGKVVEHARAYAREFEKVGISKDRFCIKIPCTGPALNASPILLNEGIRTLGTTLYSLPQAIAASQAQCLSVSPYINCKNQSPGSHIDRCQWPDVEDPALQHPMSPRTMHIQETYARLYKETGIVQPLLKPASFISAREVMALGELGCHHATIPEDILQQLSLLSVEANPPPGATKTDPLSGPNWDGKFAPTSINYLANNGAALEKAINDIEIAEANIDQVETLSERTQGCKSY